MKESDPPSSSEGVSACPTADEIERSLAEGSRDERIAAHVAGCAACRASAAMIRENAAFMREFLGEVGEAAAAAPAASPPPADILPGYHIVSEIARGGQGTVYEAIQTQTKRRVAIKMLEPGPRESRGRRRIEREAEITAGLRHPNLVTVYDSAALPDGRYALAMEFVDGVTLDEWARRLDAATSGDRVSAREAVGTKLRAVAAVCDAVQYAHQNGVIHRDLKPANVLVDAHGVPRVVDFGIARRLLTGAEVEAGGGGAGVGGGGGGGGVTRAGEFAGTLAYASPEQVSGDPDAVDTRSDVYSLGVMLYEVLTGRRPYKTEGSLTGAVASITAGAPEPMGVVQPGDQPASDDLRTIVGKALNKDRTHRYQTAGGLRSDIDNLLNGRAIDAKRESTLYVLRKAAAKHRAAVVVAAAFLVVLASFAVAMAWSARRLDSQRELLASALSASTIERGRLSGIGGSSAQAEGLIWPEMLRSGADLADPALGFRSTPEATQAAWALFELYSRHPSLLHAPVMPGADLVEFVDNGKAIRLVRPDGAQEYRALPDGRFMRNYAPTLPAEVRPLTTARPRRFSVARDPDGLVVIDSESGARRRIVRPELRDLTFAEATPDGTRLVTVDRERRICIWTVEPAARVAVLGAGVAAYPRPFVTDDGRLVVAGDGKFIRVWHTEDGVVQWSFRVPDSVWSQVFNASLQVAAISADSRRVVAGFVSTLLVFDTQNPGAPPMQIAAHRGWINFVGFSGDSSALLSSGSERDYLSWDVRTGELLSSMSTSVAMRGYPSLSHDGSLAGICETNDRVRVWQTRSRGWLHRLTEPTNTVFFVRFNADGSLFTAASADGRARVWRASDRTLVWTSPAPEGEAVPLTAACFVPGSGGLIVADRAGALTRWTQGPDGVPSGPPRRFGMGPELTTWIGCTADGERLVVAGGGPRIRVFDVATGAEGGPLESGSSRIVECAFGPDGRTLAAAGGDGVCTLWDLETRTPVRRLEGHGGAQVRAVCYSPDGRTIATGGDDWTIRLWDAGTGECVRVIRDARQHVFGLAFHPDGNLLFSCCRDPVVQVWDVRTGRELASLEGHERLVLTLAMSRDGKTLVSGSADNTVGVWDLSYYQTHVRCNAGAWEGKPEARTTSEGRSGRNAP